MYVGIGNPPGTMDMKAYLLQKFSDTERKQVFSFLILVKDYLSYFILKSIPMNESSSPLKFIIIHDPLIFLLDTCSAKCTSLLVKQTSE